MQNQKRKDLPGVSQGKVRGLLALAQPSPHDSFTYH